MTVVRRVRDTHRLHGAWLARVLLFALVLPPGLFAMSAVGSVSVRAEVRAAAPASTTTYVLGPMDKVRIRVYQWRASKDEIIEWPALREEFTVGADGSLSLPLIGTTSTLGLTTADLARLIGERLKDRLKLLDPPDTAVEVVQYRPFFVVGDVEKPGEYPYRPGMSVLQAVALAGGLKRTQDAQLMRLDREAIAAEGEIRIIRTEIDALLARRARYEAELGAAADITFPPELLEKSSDPAISLLLDQERLIFNTRKTGIASQLSVLEQLKSYLRTELSSLAGQIVTQQKQIDLVRSELGTLRELEAKGLAAAPRLLQLRRLEAQLESERLRLTTADAKAQQEISKTDIAIIDLRNKLTNEVAGDLRQTQARLQELSSKAETSAQLLYESRVIAPQLLDRQAAGTKPRKPTFKIVRTRDGYGTEVAAGEATAVEPGDTLSVQLKSEDAEIPVSMDGLLGSILKSAVIQPLNVAPSAPSGLHRNQHQGQGFATPVSGTGLMEASVGSDPETPEQKALAQTRDARRVSLAMISREGNTERGSPRPSQPVRAGRDETAAPPSSERQQAACSFEVALATPSRRPQFVAHRGALVMLAEPPLPEAKPVGSSEQPLARRLDRGWYAQRSDLKRWRRDRRAPRAVNPT